MAIRSWHYGKLILLWAWGGILMYVAFAALITISRERYLLGTFLVVVLVGIPLALTALTWRWLGAKEKPE